MNWWCMQWKMNLSHMNRSNNVLTVSSVSFARHAICRIVRAKTTYQNEYGRT
ncbi:hypothetical protein Pjdr2_1601 [Paenibacillus sp. JDR-2]|nr:hypothetical protein Pjdr2_1601 [Paenibacillus sp. JDR-2]